MAENTKVVTTNRKAFHDYHILETTEVGIVLVGTEIKSVREGRVNLKDCHARIDNGEMVLHGMHIGTYDHGNRYNHDPTRPRKLLLHKKEIWRLMSRVQERGLTLVPLKVYLKRGRAKVELALAKGKKEYDKREAIARREAERDMARALKEARQES